MRPRKHVVVPVDVLNDRRLSTFDIGLFVYILANENRLSKIESRLLSRELKESKDTIRNGLVRLNESGYLAKDSRLSGYRIPLTENSPSDGEDLAETRPDFSQTSARIQTTKETEETEEKRTKREDKEGKEEYIYNNNPLMNFTEDTEIREKEKTIENFVSEDKIQEKEKPRRKQFVKPTLEEVQAYCRERESTVSAYAFYDWYESNGWRVGKNPMKDWKAAIRTWEQKDRVAGKYYVPPENINGMKKGGVSEECPF